MNRLKSSLVLLKNPIVIMYLVGILLFTIGLFLTYKVRPFNSDDVFWQVILANGWLPFDGSTVTMGNSSIHIDKLPLYWLSDLVGLTGRKALFVQSLLIGLASFSAFYWGSTYLLKRFLGKARLSYASLLPFLWVAISLGYSFFTMYLDPNWRGFQIGFAFVLFALTYAFWHGDITLKSTLSKIVLVLLAAYVGLLGYGDPYILYFVILPLAVFTILSFYPLKKIPLRTAIFTTIGLGLTFIFLKLFGVIGSAAGIVISIPSDVSIVAFSQLGNNIGSTIQSILTVAGADFFGLGVNRSIIFSWLNFVILAIAAFGIYFVAKKKLTDKKKDSNTSWAIFIIALIAMTVAFYTLTTMNGGVSTHRYMLFTILLVAFIFAYFMSLLKNKKVIVVISALIVLSAVLSIPHLARTSTKNQANNDNNHLVALLQETGYTKGYAEYWDAGINSYLSGGDIKVLPTICSAEMVVQWHWLINDAAYIEKADKSFFIYNSIPSGLAYTCTLEMLTNQAGNPSKTIEYNNFTIYLYDHDIISRI